MSWGRLDPRILSFIFASSVGSAYANVRMNSILTSAVISIIDVAIDRIKSLSMIICHYPSSPPTPTRAAQGSSRCRARAGNDINPAPSPESAAKKPARHVLYVYL
ncbi:hypothetical protein F5Y06DRAFT_276677 [Hypoxylon sp. FL0890]|nr:hypothetical protein F5Y06DRAFT_276677 [Hypoxylon sp. FL0890]